MLGRPQHKRRTITEKTKKKKTTQYSSNDPSNS
jgi:hypothetical protein